MEVVDDVLDRVLPNQVLGIELVEHDFGDGAPFLFRSISTGKAWRQVAQSRRSCWAASLFMVTIEEQSFFLIVGGRVSVRK
jgi:hypothetical protein